MAAEAPGVTSSLPPSGRELLASADVSACIIDSNSSGHWVTLNQSEVSSYPQSNELRMGEGHPKDNYGPFSQKQRRDAGQPGVDFVTSWRATQQQAQVRQRFGGYLLSSPESGSGPSWVGAARALQGAASGEGAQGEGWRLWF